MSTVTREFYNAVEVNLDEFSDEDMVSYLQANGWVCKRAPDHAHAWMDEQDEIVIPAAVANDICHLMVIGRRQDAIYEALRFIGDQIGRPMV